MSKAAWALRRCSRTPSSSPVDMLASNRRLALLNSTMSGLPSSCSAACSSNLTAFSSSRSAARADYVGALSFECVEDLGGRRNLLLDFAELALLVLQLLGDCVKPHMRRPQRSKLRFEFAQVFRDLGHNGLDQGRVWGLFQEVQLPLLGLYLCAEKLFARRVVQDFHRSSTRGQGR